MIFCCHRINTIKQLKKIPTNFGIEIDINTDSNKLVLKHDPFGKGELLEKFLEFYRHKFLILNVKSEGLEKKIFKFLKKKKLKNYFFLDSSFPYIYKLSKKLTKKFAVRVSDIECINTAFEMKNKIKWVWLDCFKNYNVSIKNIKKLQNLNFKICLVAPDLHKRKVSLKDKIFFRKLKKNNIKLDMVCSKEGNYQYLASFFPSLLNSIKYRK
jgi:hypothetical protein